MRVSLVGMVLSTLLPDALKALAALVLALFLAVGFVVASIAAILSAPQAALPTAQASPGVPAATSDVVALAYQQLGMPYVWGGASPQTSFDCSGLVQWVYGQVGVRLPRTAQQQYNATDHVADADLSVGDLVFFRNTYYSPGEPITHVGIYVGNGRMINAPTTGDIVREMPIFSDPYWSAHYAGAGRVRR